MVAIDLHVNHQRLISRFLDLVKIDSESGKESAVAHYIRGILSRFDIQIEEDDAGNSFGGDCGNLLARVPSRGRGVEVPGLILNAHMDTVVPGKGVVPVSENGVIRSAGNTILGADDKAGIAVILEVLESLEESNMDHPYLELLFTVGEEIGLMGVKGLKLESLGCDYGYVLDGPGEVGGIVIRAPGREDIRVTVTGQTAHAGIEPEKGVNSIQCAAKAISWLDMGRIDEETTVNLGTIHGGKASNIVPGSTEIEAEIRSHDEKKLVDERDKFISSFNQQATAFGCELDIVTERSFDAFSVDTNSYPVVLLVDSMKTMGVSPRFLVTGGGSDNNILAQSDKYLVTVSIGLMDSHSENEYILEEDIKTMGDIMFRTLSLEPQQ